MPICKIDNTKRDIIAGSWNLDDKIISDLDIIKDFKTETERLRSNVKFFHDMTIEDLLDFFDSLANYWMSNKSDFLRKYAALGVTFLISFLKKSNLIRLLKASLKGNISYLNTFIFEPELRKKIMAQPRGLITHWLAGNVPVLGMISLVQGMLSKNANVIKLPRENGLVLPSMFTEIANYEVKINKGKVLSGEKLADALIFVYCEKDDFESQSLLSLNSDVRVAWGGKEAVESVLSLPKKYYTEDVIFGPKYSFAVIGRNSFEMKDLDDIVYKLAIDASVFEQQGCNSPHTIFVEKKGEVSPLDFAKALARGMEKALKRIPKQKISAAKAYSIVNIRSEYSFFGEVFSSKGTEWTVIYSDEKELADPCYSRVVFVRPVDDINEIINYVDHNKQTLGLLIDDERKIQFAKHITAKGIERITDIGKMTLFDYPWDGMFPIDRFVRWVSLE